MYGLYFVPRKNREWYEEGIVHRPQQVRQINGDVSFLTGFVPDKLYMIRDRLRRVRDNIIW